MLGKSHFKCFLPIVLLVAGFLTGVIIYYEAPHVGNMEWAGRFCSLVLSILLWAIGLVVQGKRLYCCGSEERERSEDAAHGAVVSFLVLLAIIAVVFLIRGSFVYYSLALVAIAAILIAEIGWGWFMIRLRIETK